MGSKNKIRQRETAKALFMERTKMQKEIAVIVGVTEKTISRWAIQYGWQNERNARLMSDENIRTNGKLAMNNHFQTLIDLQNKRAAEIEKPEPDRLIIEELDKSIMSYTHAIAQANKGVQEILKGNRITLSVYLQVMEDIFNTMLAEDSKLHAATMDFQERHIQFICKKLG